MTDEKAVEPIDDQTQNIEDAVVVEDMQEAVSDEPSEDVVADALEEFDTERKSSGAVPLVVDGSCAYDGSVSARGRCWCTN